jgi:hypothetical protein
MRASVCASGSRACGRKGAEQTHGGRWWPASWQHYMGLEGGGSQLRRRPATRCSGVPLAHACGICPRQQSSSNTASWHPAMQSPRTPQTPWPSGPRVWPNEGCRAGGHCPSHSLRSTHNPDTLGLAVQCVDGTGVAFCAALSQGRPGAYKPPSWGATQGPFVLGKLQTPSLPRGKCTVFALTFQG